MPLHCPHCDTEQLETDQPDTAQTCPNCGMALPRKTSALSPKPAEVWYGNWRPPTFSFVPLAVPPPPISSRGLLWKIPAALALLTAAVLALLIGVPQYAAKSSASDAQPLETAKPAEAAASPRPAPRSLMVPVPKPLRVTLHSDSAAGSLPLGQPVTVSVAAALPQGHSATLTVFYRHERGAKQRLAQAQGSLCRAAWTPLQAGLYEFTATALDDQRRIATAPVLVLHVAAPPQALGLPIAAKNAAPLAPAAILVPAAMLGPLPKQTVAKHWASLYKMTARRKPGAKKAAFLYHSLPGRDLPRPTRFHVAAAAFPYERNAAVLASALRTHGFMAVVRKGKNGRGQPAYVVQTGVFPSPAAAHQQALKLQSDGYPAFTYTNP